MTYMLQKECLLQQFCEDKNFLYRNGKNAFQPKVLKIIIDFLNKRKNNYIELRNNLSPYKDIFQYVYSNVFPKIYCSTERRGFNLKSTFHIIFKTYKDKKTLNLQVKTRKITKAYAMKHMVTSKNQLTILMTLEKNK